MIYNNDLSQGDWPESRKRSRANTKLKTVRSAGQANKHYKFKASRSGISSRQHEPDFFSPKPKSSHMTCNAHTNYGGYDAACVWCNLIIGGIN